MPVIGQRNAMRVDRWRGPQTSGSNEEGGK
jgi:hypothetical protein